MTEILPLRGARRLPGKRLVAKSVRFDHASLGRGEMHYAAAGDGPPIVLLHGWPGFWIDWRDVIPPASALGRVVAPDYFGFGDSDVVAGSAADVADESDLARDVLDLLDHLGLERAVLVGQDIGSAVAPAVWRLAPERVAGLVLLNPTHPNIGAKRFARQMMLEGWYQQFHLLPLAEQLLDGRREAIRAYLAHFYDHWAGRAKIGREDFEHIVDVYARPGAFASSIAWYRARAARRSSQADGPPPPVTVPTIAVWGDSDPMRPLEHREGFDRAFSRALHITLEGVGHFVAGEAPDQVVAAIRRVLQEADRA